MEVQTLKCRGCTRSLDITQAVNGVIRCPACGTVMTVAKSTDDRVIEYLRAGNMSLESADFDGAFAKFQSAADLDGSESEAYFGMALAFYRVQYLTDKQANGTNVPVPICHEYRDSDFSACKHYKKAIELATDEQKAEYRGKAAQIDRIRSEFIKLKKSGLYYDCFICVKVSDDNGGYTQDSTRANKIYNELTKANYRPFFSEFDNKGFTGADYEARILYALCRSKCMIVVCSDASYLTTRWVNNEITRWSELIKSGDKDGESITVVFSREPIERLPGIERKIQGIKAGEFDKPLERITEFINRFSAVRTEAIKRRDYADSRQKKKQAVRTGVSKHDLAYTQVAGAEVSTASRLAVVEGLLREKKFDGAKKICQDIIAQRQFSSRLYWLLFLAENRCDSEKSFIDGRDRIASFDSLEKAIGYSAAYPVRFTYYAALAARTRQNSDLQCFTEYIQLPDSNDAEIAALVDMFYKLACNTHSTDVFDAIAVAVSDADKYIRMNTEFARLLWKYDRQAAVKYYKNVLSAYNADSEALYRVFEYGKDDVFEFCASAQNRDTLVNEVYGFGFNEFATDRLFEECADRFESDTAAALDLLDFILRLVPEGMDAKLLTMLHRTLDGLFERRQSEYAKKYAEYCLSIDANDDLAYFYRLLVSNDFDNPLCVLELGDGLDSEPDFISAMSAYAEKHPHERENFYLQVGREMQNIRQSMGESAFYKRAARVTKKVYVPIKGLNTCSAHVAYEADRILSRRIKKQTYFTLIPIMAAVLSVILYLVYDGMLLNAFTESDIVFNYDGASVFIYIPPIIFILVGAIIIIVLSIIAAIVVGMTAKKLSVTLGEKQMLCQCANMLVFLVVNIGLFIALPFVMTLFKE